MQILSEIAGKWKCSEGNQFNKGKYVLCKCKYLGSSRLKATSDKNPVSAVVEVCAGIGVVVVIWGVLVVVV